MSENPPSPPDNAETAGLLKPEDIEEFKRIVEETTGEVLSDQEAWDRATELVTLYRMLLGPIPEDPDLPFPKPPETPETYA